MIAQQIKIDMRCVVEAVLRRIARLQLCRRCGDLVEMVTAREAAIATDTSHRSIFRWAEAGMLHYATSRDGALLICANSLQRIENITRRTANRIKPGDRPGV